MVEILDEKICLLVQDFADRRRKIAQGAQRTLGVLQLHRAGLAFLLFARRFLMLASTDAAISSTVLKGP
jgi:hypothetical protein